MAPRPMRWWRPLPRQEQSAAPAPMREDTGSPAAGPRAGHDGRGRALRVWARLAQSTVAPGRMNTIIH